VLGAVHVAPDQIVDLRTAAALDFVQGHLPPSIFKENFEWHTNVQALGKIGGWRWRAWCDLHERCILAKWCTWRERCILAKWCTWRAICSIILKELLVLNPSLLLGVVNRQNDGWIARADQTLVLHDYFDGRFRRQPVTAWAFLNSATVACAAV
jgi:hypothetical protein